MGNRHTGRNTVRIDDDVRNNARRGLRHILRFQNHADCSLLSVARAELIADGGNPFGADTEFHETESLAVPSAVDFIHKPRLIVSQHTRGIAVPFSAYCLHCRRCRGSRHGRERTMGDSGSHGSLDRP